MRPNAFQVKVAYLGAHSLFQTPQCFHPIIATCQGVPRPSASSRAWILQQHCLCFKVQYASQMRPVSALGTFVSGMKYSVLLKDHIAMDKGLLETNL